MSINIKIRVVAGHLHVNCDGIFTKDAMSDVIDKIFVSAQKEDAKKIFINVSEVRGDSPTTIDRFELGKEIAIKQRTSTVIKIAVVGKAPIVDPQRFSETVALNYGAYFKVFTDITQANNWLEK